MEAFVAGFAYGACTVVVGQPFDTLKTLKQTGDMSHKSMSSLAKWLWSTSGISGFYRGGGALLLGGGLMRSAQFGVYTNALSSIQAYQGKKTAPHERFLGVFDPQVVVAGFWGGIGRGLVEAPFEFIKVRRQLVSKWTFRDLLSGSGVTLFRNSFLFSSFVIYIDLSKQLVPGGLGPFLTGAICSNLSWFTFWPLDVVKSRIQSGKYEGQGMFSILRDTVKQGHMYRGLLPGLTRSFVANGCSMEVYVRVEKWLKDEGVFSKR